MSILSLRGRIQLWNPSLYADFNNVDPDGRIRLNTAGTLEDLERLRL